MLIGKVLNNILKSFKRHIINKNEIIDYNEKLLLWNNIIKSHDFYIKNNKDKKGSYSIPCLFKSYINNENIKIIFDTDITEEYKKGIEISVNINACIIVPEFVYNYYIIKNNQVKDEGIEDIEDNNIENKEELIDYMQYLNEDVDENISNYENKNNNIKKNSETQLN